MDRGPWQLQHLCLLLLYKITFPDRFFMNRGNHEDIMIAMQYGFFTKGQNEVKKLFESSENPWAAFFSDDIDRLFGSMPYCSCIGGKIFVGYLVLVLESSY